MYSYRFPGYVRTIENATQENVCGYKRIYMDIRVDRAWMFRLTTYLENTGTLQWFLGIPCTWNTLKTCQSLGKDINIGVLELWKRFDYVYCEYCQRRKSKCITSRQDNNHGRQNKLIKMNSLTRQRSLLHMFAGVNLQPISYILFSYQELMAIEDIPVVLLHKSYHVTDVIKSTHQ